MYYIDLVYARFIDSRKFIGSYILILSNEALSNQSKLENTIALLLCKAKHITIIEVSKEAS